MWDRLIQQCIKQVLEPICEAKFSENSYGFRPNRSVENAIKATYNRLQISQLHYVIEFDIKGFFDNVNHSKLIKQIWAMGIRDKHLIFILKRILKAPIKMTNGTITYPEKGTPKGGIISPLLADQFIYAGSVFEANGKVHAFYTGYNREFLAQGKTSVKATLTKK
ncbi:hypothetical protein EfmAA242_19390 [Enterococcus faecium]|nr:hypothetical protein EfmAA242_19390 [Enterococcus faecium]